MLDYFPMGGALANSLASNLLAAESTPTPAIGADAGGPPLWFALAIVVFLAVLFGLFVRARTRLQSGVRALAKAAERVAIEGDFRVLDATSVPAEVEALRDATFTLGAEIKAKRRSLERTKRLFRLTTAFSRALADFDDEIALLERFCRLLVLVGHYRFVWLGFEHEGELHRIAKFSYNAFEDLDPYLLWSLSRPEGAKGNAVQSLLKTAQWQVSRRTGSASGQVPTPDTCVRALSTVALPLRPNEQVAGVVLICSDDAFDHEERLALTQMTATLAARLGKLEKRQTTITEPIH